MSHAKQIILIMLLIVGFAAFMFGMYHYSDEALSKMLILPLIIGGGLLVIMVIVIAIKFFLRHQPEAWTISQRNKSVFNMIYLILWLALALHFAVISGRDLDRVPPFYILIILALGAGLMIFYRKTKGLSLWDFLTIKAKDEREQQIINEAGRKAYAFTRILLFLVMLFFWSGLFSRDLKLNDMGIGFMMLFLVTFSYAFFKFSVGDLGSPKK